MTSPRQTLRWAGLALQAIWRFLWATIRCAWTKDPLAADAWLIRTLLPRFFRAARADFRRPPSVPALTDGPYVLIANHQSHLDVAIFAPVLPLPLRLVGKPALFRVPIFGWYMKVAGHLVARRRDAVVAAGLKLLDQGYTVGFFPEGTRTTEDALAPFKPGAFLLAAASGRPILPVAIFGAGRVLPSGSRQPRPGPVGLRIGEPIPVPPAGEGDPDALMAAGRAALERLRALGPPPEMGPPRPEDDQEGDQA